MKLSRILILEKTTPGALKYVEIDDAGKTVQMQDAECALGTQYIRKNATNGEQPKKIRVTVESVD